MRILLVHAVLFVVAFASLVPIAGGGSPEAPEVMDISFDVTFSDGKPACQPSGLPAPAPGGQCLPPASFANLISGWVAVEEETQVILNIDSANNANAYGPALYEFHFTIGTTDYVAGLSAAVSPVGGTAPTPAPSGVATAAEWVETIIVITVPRSAIGNPTLGASMTKMFLTSSVKSDADKFIDRAPNGDAFGLDYTFALGPAAGGGNVTTGNSTTTLTNTTVPPALTNSTTASSTMASGTTSQTASSATNDTAADEAGSTDTPNLGIPLLAVTVAVVGWVVRRRLPRD